MSKMEKEIHIHFEECTPPNVPIKISWYSSYICDAKNYMYSSEDEKIYNFTVVYNTKYVTPEHIQKLSDLIESLIDSKTIRNIETSFLENSIENTVTYYFTNANQYNKIVTKFTN